MESWFFVSSVVTPSSPKIWAKRFVWIISWNILIFEGLEKSFCKKVALAMPVPHFFGNEFPKVARFSSHCLMIFPLLSCFPPLAHFGSQCPPSLCSSSSSHSPLVFELFWLHHDCSISQVKRLEMLKYKNDRIMNKQIGMLTTTPGKR